MKGIVFTEFFEMVEEKFGFEVADRLVNETELASGGIYTAVGTYSHQEIVVLVVKLSEISEIPLPKLLNAFGHHLFKVFEKSYNQFFENVDSCFDFLSKIENYIHVEVLKLYPDAELPKFEVLAHSDKTLVMQYESKRSMSDLAEGLMEAAAIHFKEPISVEKEMLEGDGSKVKFTLTKK